MKRIFSTAILLALTVVLGTGCAGMGGQRDAFQAAVDAQAQRDAEQDQVLASIAAELKAAREAREAAPEPVQAEPEPVADGDSDEDAVVSDEPVVAEAVPAEPVVVSTLEPVQSVATPLADDSGTNTSVVGFQAEDRAKACVEDLMRTGADVERPTSAVKAAYVCSHLYGLDHDRGLENRSVSHELNLDGKAFTAGLEQRKARFQHVLNLDDGNDDQYRLGGSLLLPASLSADNK